MQEERKTGKNEDGFLGPFFFLLSSLPGFLRVRAVAK
jgi:hypothetical protein